jgi:type II secretory pathway pseudopilin PulG
MRLRRIVRWWPLWLVVGMVLIAIAAWPGRYTFTVSPETTYVTGPVDAEGFVDYPAALNDRLADGVPPEKNAKVLIWQCLGPHPEGGTMPMPPEYFRRLGVPSPPEEGDYFVPWEKYFQAHLQPAPGAGATGMEREQWDGRQDRARRWPWKAADEPELADWLRQNEKPLAVAIEATKRPLYYNPLVSTSSDPRSARLIGSLLPSVQRCRSVGDALVCRAMDRAGAGDYDGAWQDLLACQRLGRLVARGATLIENLVGIALVSIATNAEITLLGHGKHSSKQILAWLADLRNLPPMPPLADKLAVGERFMTLDALMGIAATGPRLLEQLGDAPGSSRPPNPVLERLARRSIDFDPAFRNVNRMFDRCAEACRQADRATRKQEFAKIVADVQEMKAAAAATGPLGQATMGKATRGEHIGNLLISLLLPAFEKIQDASDRTEQQQNNLHLAFALAAYRADTGRYPPRLDDLAPKYLPAIPADVFSGKPLNYRPNDNGYLLYSVGLNGLDEEGRSMDDQPRGDDLRVRMPVEPPAAKERG